MTDLGQRFPIFFFYREKQIQRGLEYADRIPCKEEEFFPPTHTKGDVF